MINSYLKINGNDQHEFIKLDINDKTIQFHLVSFIPIELIFPRLLIR